jgi:circadian clock protein KaiB
MMKQFFRLYVAGEKNNQVVIHNLKKITKNFLDDEVVVEIIDLIQNPQIALEERIIALPQLVRISPEPLIKLFGDLSDTQKVLYFLDRDKKQNNQ